MAFSLPQQRQQARRRGHSHQDTPGGDGGSARCGRGKGARAAKNNDGKRIPICYTETRCCCCMHAGCIR